MFNVGAMKANRIAVYGRVSTVAQNHASQLREVRAYVRRRWPKAEIIEYLEKASGAKFSRDALDAMMSEVRKGRIDIIAIYKLDRLGRSLQHLAQLIGELKTHRTALVSTSQGIDTSESNSASRLQMNVLLAVAEFERDAIIERINAGLAAARERGVKLGSPAHAAQPSRCCVEAKSRAVYPAGKLRAAQHSGWIGICFDAQIETSYLSRDRNGKARAKSRRL